MADLALLGKVVSVRGLRGELKVFPHTDSPDFFCDIESVLVRDASGGMVRMRIADARHDNGMALIRFEGVNSRDDAERLRGAELLLPAAEMPPLPDGRYYRFQIEGLDVRTNDGRRLGVVEEIMETGGNDVYVVRPEHGPEILVPAIPDVIVSVDLEKGEIVIEPLEGMIE
ncbi:MAG: 16S rRNA processing protein RimM [Nitrospirae bacterium]|nr:16S rRNA processing protein RimM [Nitrospirota bacterium]